MEEELKTLEEKVQQLAALCHRLRHDNRELRQQLAQAVNDNKQLTDKIDGAKTRLEALLTQIPESDT
jgi:cell division protein ZapB